MSSTDADDVFRGLTDPTRRAILRLLSENDEMGAGQIAEHFPEIGRTAISTHLRVLRESDMVAEERDGRRRVYRLGPNRADSAIEFLQRVYALSVTPDEIDPVRRRGPGRPPRARRVG